MATSRSSRMQEELPVKKRVHSGCRQVLKSCATRYFIPVTWGAFSPNVVVSCALLKRKAIGSTADNSPLSRSKNSSSDTRNRAKALAASINSYHIDIDITKVTDAVLSIFTSWAHWTPRFRSQGGSSAENLALQNIQARSRMVLGICPSYLPLALANKF